MRFAHASLGKLERIPLIQTVECCRVGRKVTEELADRQTPHCFPFLAGLDRLTLPGFCRAEFFECFAERALQVAEVGALTCRRSRAPAWCIRGRNLRTSQDTQASVCGEHEPSKAIVHC